ncbi:formin-like protein 3 [Branchiostoma floridae]|uniref:Formin-like protein 3 n=1 Tax=Branchiostoma floridae TaxID=7739 RepID=A0A9J7HNZ2_BRAFL|nr:formin-like protein 3 [Branchiostoma floridae]
MDASLDNFMREKVRLKEYGETLEKLAADCETNYVQAGNSQARAQAFHSSRQSAAKALTDVAYRINLLAQTLVNVLDNQNDTVKRLGADIGQLDTQADIRLETAAKQRVFALTAKQPPVEERPKVDGPKYVRRTKVEMKKFPPLNYNSLDRLGHGLILTPSTSVGRLSGVVDMDKFRAKQAEELNLPPDENDEDAKTDQVVEDMYSKLRKGRSFSKSKVDDDDENVYERVDDSSGRTFGARTLERLSSATYSTFGRSASPSSKNKTLPPGGKNSPKLTLNRNSSLLSRPKHAPPPPPAKVPLPPANGTASPIPPSAATNRNASPIPPPTATNQNASPVSPSTATNQNASPIPPPPQMSANQSADAVAPLASPEEEDDSSAGTPGSFLAAIRAAKLKSRNASGDKNGAQKKEGVRVSVNDYLPPPPP